MEDSIVVSIITIWVQYIRALDYSLSNPCSSYVQGNKDMHIEDS
jgi:hypothetical protein